MFLACDEVVMLRRGGETVYAGPTARVSSYFEDLGFQCPPKTNPADFYLDVISDKVSSSKSREVNLAATWKEKMEDYKSQDLTEAPQFQFR